jgi:hypothetical protein
MLQDSPMSPAVDAADRAWEEFREAQSRFAAMYGEPDVDQAELRVRLQRAATAERTYKRLFLAIDDPTPPSRERDNAWLACEGVLLVSASVGSTLVPANDSLSSLMMFGFGILALGAWAGSFLTRLFAHWRLP